MEMECTSINIPESKFELLYVFKSYFIRKVIVGKNNFWIAIHIYNIHFPLYYALLARYNSDGYFALKIVSEILFIQNA